MQELQRVSEEYNTREQAIRKNIHGAQSVDNLRLVMSDIIDLQVWLSNTSQSSKMPAYELKLYTRSLQNLVLQYDETKAKFINKKFKFSHTPQTDLTQSKNTNDQINDKASKGNDIYTATLDGIQQKRIILDKASGNVYIRNISDSVISLPKNLDINSVTIEKCTDSILILHSNTFLFIDSLVDCLVIGSCQQLRVHNTHSSILNITITSTSNRLIIENCNDLGIVKENPHLTVDDFRRPNQPDISTNTDENFHFIPPTRIQHLNLGMYITDYRSGDTIDRSTISQFISDAKKI
mgnify:CR=1 FL=1